MPIRMHQFDGSGRSRAGERAVLRVLDPDTGEVLDGVSISYRVIDKAEQRRIFQDHVSRTVNPGTKSVEQNFDSDGWLDALCVHVIMDWEGIVGADDQPLVVNPETIRALDDRIKAQVSRTLAGGEVTGRGPESFRGARALAPMVDGQQDVNALLPERKPGRARGAA